MSLLFVLLVMTADPTPLTPGEHQRKLPVDGRDRNYLIHVPKSYDATKPTPVVLVFHGGGSNAAQTAQFTGMNEKSDEAGFLAVYPNGTGRLEQFLTWNAGNCCGHAQNQKVDDVAFVRALLDDFGGVANVDKRRVFATGISNGAMISYRLASDLSNRIAAIAPVGGPMGTESCSPQRPVPVMHFHGTDDKFAPFAGGIGEKSLSRTRFLSVEHSISAWVKANGCQTEPGVTEEAQKIKDGTRVIRKTYGGGRNGSEVVLFIIDGGGHTWPGQKPLLNFLGPSTGNISANDLMWEFFRKHPMPE